MMLIDAVGAIAILHEKRSITPMSGVGAGPALGRQMHRGFVDLRLDVLEHAQVPRLRHRALERQPSRLEEGVEAHHAEPDRTLAHRRIGRTLHARLGTVDEVLQDIVEETHHVLDKALLVLPL
uniref:hypothetical protein n=1 Tax=Pseudomonas sp. RA_35y_Pfl2_P32 TaxID=3088705 RepID=UPI0030DBFAC2